MNTSGKKLIEVSIPLEIINVESRKRKQKAPKGYPTSIHKYWAQRPVAACRAVLFCQLVDDPSAWPDRFPTIEAQNLERKRLHDFLGKLLSWERSLDRDLLRQARWEIARSAAWASGEEPPAVEQEEAVLRYLAAHLPVIADPFSGAGSIPYEAQRLGLRVAASDLNSVAVTISKGLVEFPRAFAGWAPVNPSARKDGRAAAWNGQNAEGMAEDIRYYAEWLMEKAKADLSSIYPGVRASGRKEGSVVAWMWVRTVRSPDPRASGVLVPLASTFLLSDGKKQKTWAEPVLDVASPNGYHFKVKSGLLSAAEFDNIKHGTKTGRGANFRCLLTGATIGSEHIRSEAKAGRLGLRLMAMVVDTDAGRAYADPEREHEELASSICAPDIPELDLEMPTNPRWFSPPSFGLVTYRQLYTARQLKGLSTLSELIGEARKQVVADIRSSTSHAGADADSYANTLATYLSICFARVTLYSSSLCRWLTKDNALGAAIPQKAIEMSWDFAEANLLADSSASFIRCAKNVSDCLLQSSYGMTNQSSITQVDVRNFSSAEPVIWNTDPPYYDNIGYADISEYFYVWHRKVLARIWPDFFRRVGTDKENELVATPFRPRQPGSVSNSEWSTLDAGGKAERFFFEEISNAFSIIASNMADGFPACIYYAFRQRTETAEGTTSAGWATILQALIDSGLAIDGTWPLRTESSAALKANINTLASSIVLVCRKRHDGASTITRAEFIRALRRELPDAVTAIRRGGVSPVDMQQSVIGPGMGVFSRHARVIEDDDSPMSVRTALSLINRAWGEIENEAAEVLDAPTQVALAWFAAYGFDARPTGDLITLANAKDVPTAALFATGVFHDGRGKAALLPRERLPTDWTPAGDKTATAWECVQHTIRVLNAEDGGGEAAAALVAAMGSLAEPARALAYRLFQIATERGWAAEALAYNALAEEWPRLEAMAPVVAARGPAAAVQASLF